MRSQTLLSALAFALFSLITEQAVARPTTTTASPVSMRDGDFADTFWPDEAHVQTKKKRGDETNAGRIKRGLKPLAPKKLYDATSTHQLLPRLSDAPAQTTGAYYNFVGCASSYDVQLDRGTITADTTQAAIDACGLLTQSSNFAVTHTAGNQYHCEQNPNNIIFVDCSPGNAGIYNIGA
ncbi:hypothetical protein CI109_102759 [Kwoniella shandongensis]|uniref:Uncharacterized protein n=1 Tax=Kwoniella shandongensis TaxID=1734106 RepID=A0A5M6BV20_9TREE|nr:uncharacterized protein CI109_004919 [Kwoniella shandongensis]KAA5526716.1 hypothetical protein CI109_004919 [Kwoniella shandongensis]